MTKVFIIVFQERTHPQAGYYLVEKDDYPMPSNQTRREGYEIEEGLKRQATLPTCLIELILWWRGTCRLFTISVPTLDKQTFRKGSTLNGG